MSGPTQAQRKVTHGSLPCRHFAPSARKLMAKHTSRSFLTSVPHGAGGDGAASVKMLLCNSAAPTTVVVKRACRSAMALPAHGLATADPVCPSTIGIREGPQITLYRGKVSATLAASDLPKSMCFPCSPSCQYRANWAALGRHGHLALGLACRPVEITQI